MALFAVEFVSARIKLIVCKQSTSQSFINVLRTWYRVQTNNEICYYILYPEVLTEPISV